MQEISATPSATVEDKVDGDHGKVENSETQQTTIQGNIQHRSVVSFDPQRQFTPQERQKILDRYFKERAKFIKHIKKRTKRFQRQRKEDWDRAKWGKEPLKKEKKEKTKPQPASPAQSDSSIQSQAEKQSKSNPSPTKQDKMNRVASSSVAHAAKSTSQRAFSSSSPLSVSKRALKDKQKALIKASMLPPLEAVRVLRSIEIAYPNTAFQVEVAVAAKGNVPSLRGRATLPYDPRRLANVLLVFAETNSPSAKIAQEEGVSYVGAEELFDAVENGEIRPTKVLCTPTLLPVVTSRLGRFLGQRGMMPTVRRGGVGEGAELQQRIREAKGATDWMLNDRGVIKAMVGRLNFPPENIAANIRTFIASVRSSFPDAGKVNTEDDLISRTKRRTSKASTWIDTVHLASSQGPRLLLKDAE